MHCVTRWSRFDNRLEGVLFTEVMKLVTPKPASPAGGPEARFAMVRGENGYTANLPLEDLMKSATIFALKHDARAALGRTRLSGAPDRPAPVSLEEREMGARIRANRAG